MPHTTARYPSGMARIAVIGAGMGSLATTARLAAAGHRVTVYERAATYGGGVGRFERAGFAFDTGPGLLHLPAVWRDLFVKTCGGRRDGTLERCVDLVPVDPAARHLLPDGTDLLLPNTSRAGVTAALDAALGAGAGERWSAMLNRARQAWEATRRPLLEDTLAEDTAELGRDPYPARRGLLRRGSPTLREMAARELRDPRLEALLGSYALAYGYEPGAVPASAAVLAYLEQTFGVWYVRGGGMRALADAVYRRCLERGAEFRFGAEVTGVTEKDGRVAGVELADGSRADAEVVVRGVPEPGDAGVPGGLGRLVVLLALRGGRPAGTAHRTVVHPARPADPLVSVLRPDDAALRPDDGHEAVTLVAAVPPQGLVDWTAPGHAESVADRVVAAAEAAVPGLAGRVLWREVRTPADTERETGAPGGAVPGPVLAGAGGAFLRPGNRTALEGLYRVGGSAHPGGGLAHAGMSGAIVADLIAGGPGGSR